MSKRNAPSGRHVAGASAPSTHMMIATVLMSNVMLSIALSPTLTTISGICAQLCCPPPCVTSWSWLILIAMRSFMQSLTSCVVATLWEGCHVTLLGTWPTFFFSFLTNMYLYDHMIPTHMTAYLYNRADLLGTSLFPPFVCSPLFPPYGSL